MGESGAIGRWGRDCSTSGSTVGTDFPATCRIAAWPASASVRHSARAVRIVPDNVSWRRSDAVGDEVSCEELCAWPKNCSLSAVQGTSLVFGPGCADGSWSDVETGAWARAVSCLPGVLDIGKRGDTGELEGCTCRLNDGKGALATRRSREVVWCRTSIGLWNWEETFRVTGSSVNGRRLPQRSVAVWI